jgi:RNA polymerase sigma factor for flagellar operon FliA
MPTDTQKSGGNTPVSTSAAHDISGRTAAAQEDRDRLLTENLPEVRYIARRIHDRLPAHVSFDDLVHAGILGLIDAVDKFDPSRNVQLKSYARFRIRGAILDSLREMDWGPRQLRRQARQIEDATREMSSRLGRSPSEPEIAEKLGISLEGFQQILGELRGLDLGSLQSPSEDAHGEDSNLAVATRPEEDPFQITVRAEMRVILAQAVGELDEKEQQVLGLYYQEELTMKEVGVILDIGESRVSQIHTAALLRLRSRLREKLAPGTKPTPGAHGSTVRNSE